MAGRGGAGGARSGQGRLADTARLEERAFAIIEAAYGPEHPDTIARLHDLANTYRALGRESDALLMTERAGRHPRPLSVKAGERTAQHRNK